jgi:hypothetical protein
VRGMWVSKRLSAVRGMWVSKRRLHNPDQKTKPVYYMQLAASRYNYIKASYTPHTVNTQR